jgi:predicted nucleotidyltransferase
MVTSREDVLDILQQHEQELRALGVDRYGLFGSFLHGKITPESDVDLLIEFKPGQKTFTNFSRLALLLEELLERPVEAVTSESLSPYIGPRILDEVEYVSVGARLPQAHPRRNRHSQLLRH